MSKKNILTLTSGIALLLACSIVNAAAVVKTGTISRSLSDRGYYGGCMIYMPSTNFGANCKNSGWVSFDCEGTFRNAKIGQRLYATALVAASLKQKVTVSADDTQQHAGYCVAYRFDIHFD